MPHRSQFGLSALLTLGARVPLAAQQDQMQHGGMQHDGMKKDGMGMGKDAMGKDGMAKLSGPQVFEVPSGTDLEAFSHILLSSRKDKAALGVASLAGGGGMMHK